MNEERGASWPLILAVGMGVLLGGGSTMIYFALDTQDRLEELAKLRAEFALGQRELLDRVQRDEADATKRSERLAAHERLLAQSARAGSDRGVLLEELLRRLAESDQARREHAERSGAERAQLGRELAALTRGSAEAAERDATARRERAQIAASLERLERAGERRGVAQRRAAADQAQISATLQADLSAEAQRWRALDGRVARLDRAEALGARWGELIHRASSNADRRHEERLLQLEATRRPQPGPASLELVVELSDYEPVAGSSARSFELSVEAQELGGAGTAPPARHTLRFDPALRRSAPLARLPIRIGRGKTLHLELAGGRSVFPALDLPWAELSAAYTLERVVEVAGRHEGAFAGKLRVQVSRVPSLALDERASQEASR